MQTYTHYKESGIDWIGPIPEHWEVEKGKWLFKKEERPVLKHYEVITCFRDGQVTLRKNRREDGFTNSLKEIGYQGILKGDLVIHQMDAFAGAIGVSDSEGKSTPVYSVCTPKMSGVFNYYFSYLLRSMALSGVILSLAKGIRERSTDFRFNDFSNLLYPFPPIHEQEAIAKFLDDKTAKIDALVQTKEQQIEKLKELRQAKIHHAVTKGLPLGFDSAQPTYGVEMKDSGIEWIGEIPKHWELIPNKFIFKLKKKQVGKRSNEYDLLSLTLRGIIKRDMENPEGKFPAEFDTYQEVKVNDFVFCLFDVEETPRTVGLSTYNGMITGAYTVMERIGENFAPYLYYYYLNADEKKQLRFLYRGLRNTIPKDSFYSIKTAIPPIQEQEQIVAYLDEVTGKIDQAIAQKQEQITKLKEYKLSLINDVVTGKVKVC